MNPVEQKYYAERMSGGNQQQSGSSSMVSPPTLQISSPSASVLTSTPVSVAPPELVESPQIKASSSPTHAPAGDDAKERARMRIELIRKRFLDNRAVRDSMGSFNHSVVGSEGGDDEVDDYEDSRFKWIKKYLPILPTSHVRRYISILAMIGATWNLFVLPFRICYQVHLTLPLYFVDYFFDLIFITEIFLNFTTAFIHEGVLVKSLALIRTRYLHNGFYWQLFSTLPYEVLAATLGEYSIPYFRLIRLVWLKHLYVEVQEMEKGYKLSPSVIRISRLIFFIFCFIHTYGCLWYLVSTTATEGQPSWIKNYKLSEADTLTKYIASCYWVLTVMSTVGFGDIIPTRNAERLFAMFTMLTGAGIYALVMGTMTSIVQAMDRSANRYREKLDDLEEYIAYRKLPSKLKQRILSYYQVLWARSRGIDESKIVQDLPSSLRAAIAMYLNRPLLKKCPLFKDCTTPGFINSVVVHLSPVVALPGEYVIRQGEIGREMFFVRKGELKVIAADGKTVLKVLGDGSYFGDIALLFEARRTASIKATSYCDLLQLTKKDFDSVLEFFPDYAEVMRNRAKLEIQIKQVSNKKVTRSKSDLSMSVSKKSLAAYAIPKQPSKGSLENSLTLQVPSPSYEANRVPPPESTPPVSDVEKISTGDESDSQDSSTSETTDHELGIFDDKDRADGHVEDPKEMASKSGKFSKDLEDILNSDKNESLRQQTLKPPSHMKGTSPRINAVTSSSGGSGWRAPKSPFSSGLMTKFSGSMGRLIRTPVVRKTEGENSSDNISPEPVRPPGGTSSGYHFQVQSPDAHAASQIPVKDDAFAASCTPRGTLRSRPNSAHNRSQIHTQESNPPPNPIHQQDDSRADGQAQSRREITKPPPLVLSEASLHASVESIVMTVAPHTDRKSPPLDSHRYQNSSHSPESSSSPKPRQEGVSADANTADLVRRASGTRSLQVKASRSRDSRPGSRPGSGSGSGSRSGSSSSRDDPDLDLEIIVTNEPTTTTQERNRDLDIRI